MSNRRIPRDLRRLEITLKIGCKVNCKYCPQEILLKKYFNDNQNRSVELGFSDFKKCVSKVSKGGLIVFNGMSEPFLNKKCAHMIRYAYNSGYRIAMATTLMGCKEKDLDIIRGVNFSNFTLHIPDKENNSRFDITPEYLALLSSVHRAISITAYSCHGEVHPAISNIISKDIEIKSTLGNRAGNLDSTKFVQFINTGKILCACGATNTGWLPEMLPDGSVVLCCNDYSMQHTLGNLLKEEWIDILEGEEYKNIERGMDDESIHSLCRHCGSAIGREDISYRSNMRMFYPHVIRVARAIEAIDRGCTSIELGINKENYEILKQITIAKNICIFGLGKYFKEDYYPNMWDSVLRGNIFSDNDFSKFDANSIKSGIFVQPSELPKFQKLLTVLFVADDQALRNQLESMGLTNNISIIQLYKIFD